MLWQRWNVWGDISVLLVKVRHRNVPFVLELVKSKSKTFANEYRTSKEPETAS